MCPWDTCWLRDMGTNGQTWYLNKQTNNTPNQKTIIVILCHLKWIHKSAPSLALVGLNLVFRMLKMGRRFEASKLGKLLSVGTLVWISEDMLAWRADSS